MKNNVDESTSILIIGGGPVGFGLAIELGQRGVKSTIIERSENLHSIPKGQNLTQRTMEHFYYWGCEKELRKARTIPPDFPIGGLTAYGNLLGDYQYDWLQREKVREYYYTDNERLPQYATESVLRERARAMANITVKYGWQAKDVSQDECNAYALVEEVASGNQLHIQADYLVGCDGARSIVREKSGITQTQEDHDKRMVLLVFKSEELHNKLEKYPGKSFFNVLHPDLKGYWQFVGRVDLGHTWFFHAPVPMDTTRDNFDFTAYLHQIVGDSFEVEYEHIGFWDLRFSTADTYQAERIFIAGDAGHSHPPYGGYGLNIGFEDARNLGWKLAACLQGWGGKNLLKSYSLERQPVFASTAKDFIAKSIQQDSEFLAKFNPYTDKSAFEQEWNRRADYAKAEVGIYSPHYSGSLLISDENGKAIIGGITSAAGQHAKRAEAGKHMLPVLLSDGSNLYENLGSGLTLFAIGPDLDDVITDFLTSASKLNIPIEIVKDDINTETASCEARLILIRPDQFIAWVVSEKENIEPSEILARAVGMIN